MRKLPEDMGASRPGRSRGKRQSRSGRGLQTFLHAHLQRVICRILQKISVLRWQNYSVILKRKFLPEKNDETKEFPSILPQNVLLKGRAQGLASRL